MGVLIPAGTRIARSFLDAFWRNEINLRAAGISYYAFLALVPMLTSFIMLAVALPFWKVDVDEALLFLTRWPVPDAIHDVHDYVRALAAYAGVASAAGSRPPPGRCSRSSSSSKGCSI